MPGRGADKMVSPLNGGTQEADALAHWLCGVTKGWTTRQLAAQFRYGRNQWSEFRKGTKLIPSYLLQDLLTALIKSPQLRQLQLQKGTELLEAAEAAARARSVGAAEKPTGTALELQLRLDDARQGEIAAKDALHGTSRLVSMLLGMVSSLDQRCKELERGRQGEAFQGMQDELAKTTALLNLTNDRLNEAQRERTEAEELRLIAEQRAAQYLLVIEAMSRPTVSSAAACQPMATLSAGDKDLGQLPLQPRLWEYKLVLEAADEELATHRARMSAARQQMGIPAPAVAGTKPARRGTTNGAQHRPMRPRPPVQPHIWGSVPPRNSKFTGRTDLLELLDHHLQQGTAAVLPHALQNMGGVGKTQLAIEYAYRHQRDYKVVWWIPAERPEQIAQALVELAQRLWLGSSTEVNIAVPAVLEALRTGRPYSNWLLIFDNAECPDQVRQYFPSDGPGRILVTSRNPSWQWVASSLEVDVFSREESRELLRRSDPPLEDDEANALAAALGDLPLALEQAAAWRAETGMPTSAYLDLLESKRVELLEIMQPPGYPLHIAAAWHVSLDHLQTHNPVTLQLLQICSYFAPEPISRSIFSGLGESTITPDLNRALRDPARLARALREANRYSFARLDHRTSSLQIHRLVQLVLQNRMSPEQRSCMRQGAHTLLAASDPRVPADPSSWPRYAELHGHVLASEAIKSDQPRVRQLVHNIARYLYNWGGHDPSLEFSGKAWQVWRDVFGEEDQQTLLMGLWLGNVTWAAGRFDEAAWLAAHLTRVYESTAPADGHDTREDALHALQFEAAVHRAGGRFAAGAELDRIAYERARRVFGEDDPVTLDIAHNFAVSLRHTGDFREALQLDQRTIDLKRRLLGGDDQRLLITKLGLATDIRETGDYAGGRKLHESTCAAYQAAFGSDNPSTIEAVRQLSESCRKEGDYARSLELASDAHTQLVCRYPRAHPRSLDAALTLSVALRQSGDLEEARSCGVEVCEGYRQVYGPLHPHVLSADIDLAVTLRLLGMAEEAHLLDEAALADLSEQLGEGHPTALACAINLASDLAALGSHDHAHQRGRATLELCRTSLGEDHPTTLACAGNLALDLIRTGADAEGRALREDTLERMERVLDRTRHQPSSGTPHPATVQLRENRRANCDIDPLPL